MPCRDNPSSFASSAAFSSVGREGEIMRLPSPPRHSGAMRSIELWCAVAHQRISRFRVWSYGPSRNDGVKYPLKRADRKIAQPQIGVAAFFPETKQRPVQGLPQQVVALAYRNADAFAEVTAF